MSKIGINMSFQINNFEFSNKNIVLSYENNNLKKDHCFTILTGKNGIGKSRLLVSIVSKYLRDQNSTTLKNTIEPNKIIAISNIKTDKFPIKRNKSDKYYYIGNKSNNSFQNTDRYSIFKNLLINPNINEESVSQTFNYLGFNSIVRISFSIAKIIYTSSSNQIEKYLEIFSMYNNLFEETLPTNIFDNLSSTLSAAMRYKANSYYKYSKNSYIENNNTEFLYSENIRNKNNEIPDIVIKDIKNELNQNEISLLNCIYKLHNQGYNITPEKFCKIVNIILDLDFFKKNLTFFHNFNYINNSKGFNDILFLLELDLFTITDFWLAPIGSNNELRFNDLSSGQQSLFNILLGISGVIEDNSLICIDEPEVNLHPEWQNEFILKLQNIFNHFKGCHFIIATHSPQIVSGLTSSNGFVVDLENNITYSAEKHSKRSADFQLAKIFNTPGYNNEYILKLCFHLLSIIKEDKEPTQEDLKLLQDLDIFKKNLNLDDPSLYLIKQVQSFFG